MYNTYEAAEVIEIGKAQELILGVKEDDQQDNGTGDPTKYPAAFANFDE